MPKLGPVDAPLIPTIILVTGGYLMWFAVHYWEDTQQAYPSGPVKSVLTGKGIPTPTKEDDTAAIEQYVQATSQAAAAESGVGAGAGAAGGAAAGSGGIFSSADMVKFWAQNGGDPARAEYAAGVMMAESGGRPDVTSSNPDGGTNVGLFQLDTKGVGAGHTVAELQNAATNTRITIMATRNGTDWADWADPFVDAHGHSGNL